MSLFFILKFYILCVCITVYVCICVCPCVCVCMCVYVCGGDVFATSAWSKENMQEQYSFYHVGSRVRTHQLSMKAHDWNHVPLGSA